jgi:hypothetical protein
LRKALLVLGGSLLALAGCSTLGPRLLKGERGSYNLALQYTNDEQLLLNVVRLRYRDTPVFLEIGSLSTQFSFEASTEAGADRTPSISCMEPHQRLIDRPGWSCSLRQMHLSAPKQENC